MSCSVLGVRTVSRLLPDGQADPTLAGHLARHGNRPSCAGLRRDELIAEVERAGLAGRGGAGFPTAVKLRALAAAGAAAGPRVIANGVEGEPASDKDKVLLAMAPHLVLDGAVSAAELIGAREVVIVAHHTVRDSVETAVAERAGTDPVPVRVMTAADTFIAGEASAVLHWVERGVATPTGRPPRLGPGRLWCRTWRPWRTSR